jgi:hypothetical protein
LARKPNYQFEKRKRELDRKAKKEARAEDRRRRREEGSAETGAEGEDATTPPVSEGTPDADPNA